MNLMKNVRKIWRLARFMPHLVKLMWSMSGGRMQAIVVPEGTPVMVGEPPAEGAEPVKAVDQKCQRCPAAMLHHFRGWQKGYLSGKADAFAEVRRAGRN